MIPEATTYTTDRGIRVLRTVEDVPVEGAIDGIVDALDSRRGALFASSFEYPGRYTRWDVGFVDPLLEVACRGREVSVTALNRRGRQLLPVLADVLADVRELVSPNLRGERLTGFPRRSAATSPRSSRSSGPSPTCSAVTPTPTSGCTAPSATTSRSSSSPSGRRSTARPTSAIWSSTSRTRSSSSTISGSGRRAAATSWRRAPVPPGGCPARVTARRTWA